MKKYITKRVLLSVFMLFCITVALFYVFGSYPRYDYDFFKGATAAYSTSGFMNSKFERDFEGEELEIMLRWAKTIEPDGKIEKMLLGASPYLHFKNGDKTASVAPYSADETLVWFDGALYSAFSDAELLSRVKDIFSYYNILSFLKNPDYYYGDMDISHNGLEKTDVFNKELSALGFSIGDMILSKKPVHYDIPTPPQAHEYTDLYTHEQSFIRIYYDDSTVLPTVILYSLNRPIFEFRLGENEIQTVSRINELVEKYLG